MKRFFIGIIVGLLAGVSLPVIAEHMYEVSLNPFPIIINGDLSNIEGYNIDGFTYFKLRDLGENVGFDVYFDNWVIYINTEKFINDSLPNDDWYSVSELNNRLTLVKLSIEEANGEYYVQVVDANSNIIVDRIECSIINDKIAISKSDYERIVLPLDK